MIRRVIYGCDGRGDGDSPYLTRYTLFYTPWIHLCIHVFHRSDADELHDHPWPFASLILWGGYIEESASKHAADMDRGTGEGFHRMVHCERLYKRTRREIIRPGRLIVRSAEHAHRVELINGRKAVTLVLMGRKTRSWGFFTSAGWEHWREYFLRRGGR